MTTGPCAAALLVFTRLAGFFDVFDFLAGAFRFLGVAVRQDEKNRENMI